MGKPVWKKWKPSSVAFSVVFFSFDDHGGGRLSVWDKKIRKGKKGLHIELSLLAVEWDVAVGLRARAFWELTNAMQKVGLAC